MQRKFRTIVTLVMVLALMLNTFIVSPVAKASEADDDLGAPSNTVVGYVDGQEPGIEVYPVNDAGVYTDGVNYYTGGYDGERLILTLQQQQQSPTTREGDPVPPQGADAPAPPDGGIYADINAGSKGDPNVLSGEDFTLAINVSLYNGFKTNTNGEASYIDVTLPATLSYADSSVYEIPSLAQNYIERAEVIEVNGVKTVRFYYKSGISISGANTGGFSLNVVARFPNYTTAPGTTAAMQVTMVDKASTGQPAVPNPVTFTSKINESWLLNRKTVKSPTTAWNDSNPVPVSQTVEIGGKTYIKVEYEIETSYVTSQEVGGYSAPGRYELKDFYVADTLPSLPQNYPSTYGLVDDTESRPILQSVTANSGASVTVKDTTGATLVPGDTLVVNHGSTFHIYGETKLADGDVDSRNKDTMVGKATKGTIYTVTLLYPKDAYTELFHASGAITLYKMTNSATLNYEFKGSVKVGEGTGVNTSGPKTADIGLGYMDGEKAGWLNVTKYILAPGSDTPTPWTAAINNFTPKFQVFDASGNKKDEATIGSNGSVSFKLPPGEYYLVEEANGGYDVSAKWTTSAQGDGDGFTLGQRDTGTKITIADGETKYVKVTNTANYGYLNVYKYKNDTPHASPAVTPVPWNVADKVTFGLFTDASATTPLRIPAGTGTAVTAVVGEDGVARFTQQIPAGSYYVKETANTQEGYALSDAIHPVTIVAQELTTVGEMDDTTPPIFVNNKQLGRITIEKYALGTNTALVATFQVYNKEVTINANGAVVATENTLVDTQTTTNGTATTKDLPLGQYWIVETVAPTDYGFAATRVQTVTITADNQTAGPVKFFNPLLGSAEVTKTFGEYDSGVGVTPNVGSAKFQLYWRATEPTASENPKATTLNGATAQGSAVTVSDSTSKATWSGLQPGYYWVKETATDANYTIDPNYYYLGQITGATSTAETIGTGVTVNNPPAKGKIRLHKIGQDGKNADVNLSGVTFSVYAADTSGVKTGDSLATITTGDNGIGVSGLLAPGDYVVEENTPPTGYEKDTKNGTWSQLVTVVEGKIVDLAKTVVNYKTSKFRIIKKGEGANNIDTTVYGKTTDWVNLPGVTFQVFNNLPLAYKNLVASESSIEAIKNADSAALEIDNKELYDLMGTIATATTHAEKGIYLKNITTGANGEWVGELPAGTWYLREVYNADEAKDVVLAEGYKKREVIYQITVTDDGHVVIYNIREGTGTGSGKFHLGLKKVDGAGNPLEGAVFNVWRLKDGASFDPANPPTDLETVLEKVQDIGLSAADKNGAFVQMQVGSGKGGLGLSKNLGKAGTYWLQEVKLPPDTTHAGRPASYRTQKWYKVEGVTETFTPVVLITNLLNNGIKIKKVSSHLTSGAQTPLSDINFKVYAAADVDVTNGKATPKKSATALKVNGTSTVFSTNSNGIAQTDYVLEPGDYWVFEDYSNPDNWYVLADPIKVTIGNVSGQVIDAVEGQEIKFVNIRKGLLTIEKRGNEGTSPNPIKIDGVKFEIKRLSNDPTITNGKIEGEPQYDSTFTTIERTTAGGTAQAKLAPGTYHIIETSTAAGYDPTRLTEWYVKIVETGDPDRVILYNDKLSSLKIVKTADFSAAVKLSGAKFMLYQKVGDVYSIAKQYVNGVLTDVTEQTTNGNGAVSWTNLVPGDYYLRETAVPDGYELGIGFNIDATINGEAVKLMKITLDGYEVTSRVIDKTETVTNKSVKAGLVVTKVDAATQTTKLGGTWFNIYKATSATAPKSAWVQIVNTATEGAGGYWETETNKALAAFGQVVIPAQTMVENGVTYTHFIVEEIKATSGYELVKNSDGSFPWVAVSATTSGIYNANTAVTVTRENKKMTPPFTLDINVIKAVSSDAARTTLKTLTAKNVADRKVGYDITNVFDGRNTDSKLYDFSVTDSTITAKYGLNATAEKYTAYDIKAVYIAPAYAGADETPVAYTLQYTTDGTSYSTFSTGTAPAKGNNSVKVELTGITDKVKGIRVLYGEQRGEIEVVKTGTTPMTANPYVVDENFYCDGIGMDVDFDQRAISLTAANVTQIINRVDVEAFYYAYNNEANLQAMSITANASKDYSIDTLPVEVPNVQIHKSQSNDVFKADDFGRAGSDLVEYELLVTNTGTPVFGFADPVIADFLPAGITFFNDPTRYDGKGYEIEVSADQEMPENVEFIGPTNATGKGGVPLSQLVWRFADFELQPEQTMTIRFTAKVSAIMTQATSDYTNEAFLGSDYHVDATENNPYGRSFTSNTDYISAQNADYPELAGVDGNAPKEYVRSAVSLTANAVSGTTINKMVQGDPAVNENWMFGTDTAVTTVDGALQYKISVFNNSSAGATRIRIVDLLPNIGDTNVLSGGARNSQWRPILDGEITVKVDGATIPATLYYTESSSSSDLQNPLLATNKQGSSGYTMWPSNVWGTSPTANLAAIGIDLGDYKLAPEKTVEIVIPMKAPNYDLAFDAFYKLAINNALLYNDTYDVKNPTYVTDYGVTSQSNPTQITIYPDPVKLGDLVWYDLNGNGKQDAGEPGIEGVTVTLHTWKNGTALADKVFEGGTDANGNYLFEGLIPNLMSDRDAGTVVEGTDKYVYQVEFSGVENGYILTLNDFAGDHNPWLIKDDDSNVEARDSDAIKDTEDVYKTPTFMLDVKQYYGNDVDEKQNLSNLTVDVGFTKAVALGDYVWEDVNRNGIQDKNEPGINDIKVTLLKKVGDEFTTVFNDVNGYAVTSQMTGADQTKPEGYYWFEDLVPGIYQVQFDVVEFDVVGFGKIDHDDYFFSEPTAKGSNRANDSDPTVVESENITETDADGNVKVLGNKQAITGEINLELTLVENQVVNENLKYREDLELWADETIDAGLYRKGNIGDFVWYDENADGVQDEGEAGVGGQTVFLIPAGAVGTAFKVALSASLLLRTGDSFNKNPGALLSNWSTVRMATTDADGGYLFEDVKPGKYQVAVVKDDKYFFSPELGTADTALDSDTHSTNSNRRVTYSTEFEFEYLYYDNKEIMEDLTWDFGLFEKVSLGDYVWHDMNYNGLQDDGELGVNDVRVTLSKQLADKTWIDSGIKDVNGKTVAPQQTRTNAGKDGYYLFDNLIPGTYKVEFNITGVQYTDKDGKKHDYYFTIPTVDSGAHEETDSDADYTGYNDGIRSRLGMTGQKTLVAGVKADDPYPHLDAGLVVPASLGDYVWDDLNYDGLQDANEKGIEGVLVELYDDTGAKVTKDFFGGNIPETRTDADGLYTFKNLAPRNGDEYYTVRFRRPDGTDPDNNFLKYDFFTLYDTGDEKIDSDAKYGDLTNNAASYADSHNITLVSAQHDPTIDAGLVKYAAIGDYVWYDINDNGLQDAGEAPISGVVVELLDENGTVLRSMVTGAMPRDTAGNNVTVAVDGTSLVDANGNARAGYYYFGELIPSVNYRVRFTRPTGTIYDRFSTPNAFNNAYDATDADGIPSADQTTATTGNYMMVSGEYNSTVDEGLVVLLNLGDRVWYDGTLTNHNSRQDISAANPTEPGIANVAVALYSVDTVNNTRSLNPIATTTTDANGYYIFRDLLPGSYQVQFLRPAGYVGFVTPNIGDTISDSNASPADGFTGVIVLVDQDDMTIDAGLYTADTITTTTPPLTTTPPTPPGDIPPYGLPTLDTDIPPYGLPNLPDDDEEAPPYGLPKTGESWTTAFGMIALGALMVGVGLFLIQGRKKEEREEV